jgi:type I restriction enzyme S subunit
MSEWTVTNLDQVVALKRGFDLPESRRTPGPYPVLGSSGISGWHNTGPVTGPGVTVGRSGASIGVASYYAGPYWPLNTTLFVEDFKGSDPRYVYYLLSSMDFARYNSGSAQPSLNRNYIARIAVNIPPPSEQHAIGELLGTIDDKIAIDGLAAESALALAAAEYQLAIHQVPCRSVALIESAKWLSGGTPSTTESTYWGGDIPWISALSLKSPWIDDSDRKVTALGARSGTRLVPEDTVIFVVRGSSLDTEFRVGLTQREVAFGQDCKALQPIRGIDPAVLFIAIKSASGQILNLVDHTGHGAGRLSTDLIGKFEILVPSERGNRVATLVRSLLALGARRQVEARELGQLRDMLLPRLMSGEIRVRDAAKIVEDAP